MNNRKPNTIEQLNHYYGKVPPQAIDTEEAVLGALMLEEDAYLKVSHIIDEISFYKEEHKKILLAIKFLNTSGKQIDLLTVTQRLKDSGQLDEVGGPLYITQLTSRVASATHIEHHARIIQQKFIQRELIRIGSELTNDSFDDSQDIEEIIEGLKGKLIEIDNYSIGQNSGKLQSFVLQKAIREIELDCAEQLLGHSPGITTGLCDLNRMTGGWRNSNLVILASRPGVGKTSLALHFALSAAKAGKWVNFYGLEMSDSDLMRIVLSAESGVNRTSIKDGKLTDSDWMKIDKSLAEFENLPIIWNDFSGITANYIRSLTAKHRKAGRCDLVIVDYVQLITVADKKVNREQQIADISRTLKKTALSENVPIIALAQLNREAEGKKPELSHLRESGSLEQDADIVIFPWIEDRNYKVTIAKNRRGKVGTIQIQPNSEMTKFFDIEKSKIPPKFKPIEPEKDIEDQPF